MEARPARRPNVLLLLTDQHAPLVSGFAGDGIVRTQALDAIAADAVQFDTALCASPVCTPSRMCLMTAREAHRCAAWNNHWVIFPEHVTWPGHFAAHGYRTCLVGKMHFGGADQMQGFQHRPYGDLRHGLGHQIDPIDFFPVYAGASGAGVTEIPESLLQENVVTRESLAFLLEHQDSQPDTPWFLCASYSRPHSPFTAPGRYIRRYRDRVPPAELPDGFPDGLDDYARRCFADEVGEELTAEQQLRAREAYYACVDFVDDCIGELMRGLDAAGLLDDTIVIYTSDHGEMAGHHGLWGKTVHFEPSVGVPLLDVGAGHRAGPRARRAPRVAARPVPDHLRAGRPAHSLGPGRGGPESPAGRSRKRHRAPALRPQRLLRLRQPGPRPDGEQGARAAPGDAAGA